jgi:hypothetical protein
MLLKTVEGILLIVRKNISLDQVYVDKLKPFLERNNGNLSAAIRDTIETAYPVLTSEAGKNGEKDSIKASQDAKTRNKLIEEGEFLLVHHTLLDWLIKQSSGRLLDEAVVYELINPYRIKKIPDIVDYLNSINEKLGWKIKVDSESSQDPDLKNVNLILSNGNPFFRRILAQGLSLFMAKQMKFDVEGLFCKSNVTKVYFKRFEFLDSQKTPRGIEENFASMEYTFLEIDRRPGFWKNLIKIYKHQNYQRLNINKKIFEAFISGKIPSEADMERNFELIAGKPAAAFTLDEHIMIFREFYLTEGIGNDIEICTEKDKEYVKLIHGYSDKKVCEYIITYYSNYFRSTGHNFTVITNPYMIVFEFGKRLQQ